MSTCPCVSRKSFIWDDELSTISATFLYVVFLICGKNTSMNHFLIVAPLDHAVLLINYIMGGYPR